MATRTTDSAAEVALPETLMIVPWDDPVVNAVGFDVRSAYVDLFWLSILGPTSTWLLRHLHRGLLRYPYGYETDVAELAAVVGVGLSHGTASQFGRALQRCEIFGMTRSIPDALAVRTKVPPLSARHLARLPDPSRELHEHWIAHRSDPPRQRATMLATTMRDLGDDPPTIKRHLVAIGVDVTLAEQATDG